MQTEAPAPEYFPAAQLLQSLALVFASEPEYLPAAQSVQTEAPAAEYLPAAQYLQTQAPAANYVPAPQSVSSIRRCKTSWRRSLVDNHYRTLQSAYLVCLRTFPSGNPCRQ